MHKENEMQDKFFPPSVTTPLTLLIVAGGINCPVTKAKWAWSQSNRGTWVVTLLSKKSCTLTNGYNFWSNGTRSILKLIGNDTRDEDHTHRFTLLIGDHNRKICCISLSSFCYSLFFHFVSSFCHKLFFHLFSNINLAY